MSDPTPTPLTDAEREDLGTATCLYGWSTTAVANQATEEAVERIVAARVAAARADEREQWASYLETWESAVGWPQVTARRVIAALRGPRPFGVSAAFTPSDPA